MKREEKIQLSISLLVSNSIDTITKCMESLVPILKAIPSELIVVDTGGTDGAIEIARQYADLVIPFTWCNDFAKARNVGLEKAKGEWFLYLDDDEWFEDTREIIDFFKTGEYLNYNCATYYVRNYKDKIGKEWSDSRCYRMVKITSHTMFVSPIHEVLSPRPRPQKMFDCYVHHYGYAFETDEERRKHGERNILLLEEVLQKNPQDYRLNMQLAQEYAVVKEFEKAKKISENSIQSIDRKYEKKESDIIYAGWHMKNIVYTEILIEKRKEAYKKALNYIEYDWINTVTKNNLYHALARLAYEFGEDQECFKYLELYLKSYNFLIQNEILRKEETLLDQSESYTKENHFSSILCGIKESYRVKNKEKQREYIRELSNDKFFKVGKEDFIIIISCLIQIDNRKEKEKILESFMNNDCFRELLSEIIYDKKIVDYQNDILDILSYYSNYYPEFLKYRILYASRYGKSIKGAMDEYFEIERNILFPDVELLDIFVNKINILEYINRLSIREWLYQINDFFKEISWELLLKLREVCLNYGGYGIRLSKLKIHCYEKILLSTTINDLGYEEINGLLEEYVDVVLNYNLSIYKKEIFSNEESFYLPDNCRFCHKIKNINNETMDKLSKVRIIREAISLYPAMANFCKIYIRKMEEESEAVTREFIQLGETIKKNIRAYIESGQIENARITLNQLEQLIPKDKEIRVLKEMIQ